MLSLSIDLGARSYPIHIGRQLDPALFGEQAAAGRRVCVVDAEVARLQARRLDRLFPGLARLELPSGEASKSLAQLERLARSLLELGVGRDGLLFAVGGGVTGDLVGLLAASYLRGIPLVQVPTTLLAQVDASVGGKVAVNLPGAKNALGFFWQPQSVLADLAWLETLPAREFAAGLAELVKMAACLDESLFIELEARGESLLDPRSDHLENLVHRACSLKSAVVEADEREGGRRQILNFGHTLAHALEAAAPDPPLLHGEAVALGMLLALRLGERMGLTAPGTKERLGGLLLTLGLPGRLPQGLDPSRLVTLMGSDKKRRQGELRFVLLESWGHALYDCPVEPGLLMESLAGLAR